MASHYLPGRRDIVMTRSARRFDDRSHALDGQSGHQQAKQKRLKDSVHSRNLSQGKLA
jgi:hypothetical protein